MGVARRVAFYGNVRLIREQCPECRDVALVVEGKFTCCGEKWTGAPDHQTTQLQRITSPEFLRRPVSTHSRAMILAHQDYRCFYCGHSLSASYRRGTKTFRAKIHWDHQLPFAYSQDNRVDNFVASCNVCNLMKSSKIFETVEDARAYLVHRQGKKGISWIDDPPQMPEVRREVPESTMEPAILQRQVSRGRLDG